MIWSGRTLSRNACAERDVARKHSRCDLAPNDHTVDMNAAADNLSPVMQQLLDSRRYQLLREAGELAERMSVDVCLVGGPVRDLLLGRPQLDLDLVVEGDGLGFAEACADMWGAQLSRHESFMTAGLVLPDGGHIDIATARQETYERPGALPTVKPATLAEDLARRDFTVNALAVALNADKWGQLYDPFDGREDLQGGLIRVLHDGSFLDDPTRLVRAVGFEVRLGFSLEEHTLALAQAAIRQSALELLSPQRRAEVLLPLLRGEYAVAVSVRMGELGLLEAMHLGGPVSDDLRSVLGQVADALETLGAPQTGQPAALVYLGLLAHEAGTDLATLTGCLQVATEARRSLRTALAMLSSPPPELSESEVSPADLYFALAKADLVTAAALWARGDAAARRRIAWYWLDLRDVRADVTGEDLLAAGATPGAGFAAALDEALRVKLNDAAAGREEQLKAALDVLSHDSETSDSGS